MKTSKRLARLGRPMTAYWYGMQAGRCIMEIRDLRKQMQAHKVAKPPYSLTDEEEEEAQLVFRDKNPSVTEGRRALGNDIFNQYYYALKYRQEVQRLGRAITQRSVKLERYKRFTNNLNQ